MYLLAMYNLVLSMNKYEPILDTNVCLDKENCENNKSFPNDIWSDCFNVYIITWLTTQTRIF